MAQSNIEEIHDNGLDLRNNTIYLFGETDYISHIDEQGEPGVEFAMANRFIKNLNILINKGADEIFIHMKTCGGHWHEGIAIYDAIDLCQIHTTILSYTHARSMSSLILQAADRRIMMPHSVFMFHRGTIVDGGTVTQFRTAAEQNEKAMDQMLDIYVKSMKHSGKYSKRSPSWIKTWLNSQMDKKEDVFLSPQEAIELGFADEIYTGKF